MKDKTTILVVDDEAKIRNILQDILELEGYQVFQAKDGHGAIEEIENKNIQLVFLDLKLPGLDGIDVLRRSMELKPDLPVIIISGHGTIKTAVEAIKLGAYDFIEKPLEAQRILITIRNALAQERTEREKKSLIKNIRERYRMIGTSGAMREVYDLIEKIAPTNSRVLITGESGTGKELVARAIHNVSPRVSGPFVMVNCAAIPHELIESELFGHKKGSFTGAISDQIGKFEHANGSTLFLDEIGDMAPTTQAKVLRAIEEGEIQRIGDPSPKNVDVRVLAATNKELKVLIEKGNFRADLFYRLNVVSIHVPPLRERKEDIEDLVAFFLQGICEENNIRMKRLSQSAFSALMQYSWSGNVRELKSFVERLVILTESDHIAEEHVRALQQVKPSFELSLDTPWDRAKQEFERQFLLSKLVANEWNVIKTAKELKLDRTNIHRKMKTYRLERPSGNG
ncbi:MAG: sigma-54-dependent Fis family transcriptional regulator [Gemmatimonadota bacterium]|nr:MAG: sigma-54-dependent Fis family transcriptional regulator [Gemmatimonadota bacterium]